jgi:hypothetical protein
VRVATENRFALKKKKQNKPKKNSAATQQQDGEMLRKRLELTANRLEAPGFASPGKRRRGQNEKQKKRRKKKIKNKQKKKTKKRQKAAVPVYQFRCFSLQPQVLTQTRCDPHTGVYQIGKWKKKLEKKKNDYYDPEGAADLGRVWPRGRCGYGTPRNRRGNSGQLAQRR